MTSKRLFLAAILIFSATGHAQDDTPNAPWITGFWYATAPEDKDIKGTVMEFRADGSYILYDKDCYPETHQNEVTYREFGDEIQAQSHPPDEKPRTLIFHASSDRTRLTLLFPDASVATLERTPWNKCVAQS